MNVAWIVPVGLFALSLSALVLVYAAPQREMIRSPGGARRFLALWSAFIVVSAGLVVHNGLAALSGLFGRKGEFVRTPKRDTQKSAHWNLGDAYLPKGLGRTFALEAALWAYIGAGIALSVWNGTPYLLLGPIVAFAGLSYMLALCLRDFARQWARARAAGRGRRNRRLSHGGKRRPAYRG
jgi:hypothetical protein